MPDFSKARVGDTCFHIQWGTCVINKVGKLMISFTQAAYPNIYSHCWFDGTIDKEDILPTVYHSRPEISDPPPPKRMVKKTVWQNWYRSMFDLWSADAYPTESDAIEAVVDKERYIGTFPTEIEYEEE